MTETKTTETEHLSFFDRVNKITNKETALQVERQGIMNSIGDWGGYCYCLLNHPGKINVSIWKQGENTDYAINLKYNRGTNRFSIDSVGAYKDEYLDIVKKLNKFVQGNFSEKVTKRHER